MYNEKNILGKVHKSAFMPCCIGTFFLVPAISSLQANPSQNKTISGVVTSATDSEPLIGVSVQVRETATGGITDIDGRYSVSAQQGQTLVFSYIGYQSQEIK